MSSTNEMSGSARAVIQAGTINGDLNISYGPSTDLGVYLKHERADVRFKVDTVEWFHLTITNRAQRDRVVELRLESTNATGLVWEIANHPETTVIPLGADETVRRRLRVGCTSAALAGPDVLKALVGELDEVTGERRTWTASDALTIHVESAPGLDAVLKAPAGPVYAAGDYETVVTLENTGNTDVSGRLWVPDEAGGLERPTWLTSDQVTLPDDPRFDLGPGDPPVDIRVVIKVPVSDWFERTWQVPLAVHVERDDMPPREYDFTIKQQGDLSELIEWGRTADTWKRRTIAVLSTVVLIAGMVIGAQFGGSSEKDGPPAQAAVASSSSSQATGEPYAYSEMRCAPGTSVLVLHSIEKSTGPAEIKLLLDYETMWVAQRVPKADALKNRVPELSRRDATCPRVVGAAGEQFTQFVWIGPFPSDIAPELCRALAKTAGDNCTPAPTG